MSAEFAQMPNVLRHLEKLVAFDTRNGVGEELPCAEYLAGVLKTHAPDVLKVGTAPRSRGRADGAYVLAQWGTPHILINVHLDTVPSGKGWSTDPHVLTRKGDAVFGLGAADIKGAIACVLACLDTRPAKDVAVLFSGDEEQGSEVMDAIIARGDMSDAPMAIICEPTGALPGLRHRGFVSYTQSFSGPGGHSSAADHMAAPVLDGARVGAALGVYGVAHKDIGPEGFKGLCMNVGSLQSDGAHNVIPTHAELRMSVRPPPGDNIDVRASEIYKIMSETAPHAELKALAKHATFTCDDIGDFAPILGPLAARGIDLPYWTEAAMLSEAGKNCIVFGPGHINVAHAPDEFVTLPQLNAALPVYSRALSGEWS